MDPVEVFTIYDSPSDYPGRFVVRRFVVTGEQITPDAGPTVVADTLETARAAIPYGLIQMPRMEGDDAPIVESWL